MSDVDTIDDLLFAFEYLNLPESQREVARPIAVLAFRLADEVPAGDGLEVGLRLLLEARKVLLGALI